MHNKDLEERTGLLAEYALHDPGCALPDEIDEYARQCDFAGCYLWPGAVMCARPHDAVIHSIMRDSAVTEEGLDACG
jgi:hypothetical protein